MLSVSVSGLNELKSRFDVLGGDKQDEIMVTAFERGARTIQASVQGYAPSLSGRTKSNVIVKTVKNSKGVVTTKIQLGKGAYKGDSFYGSFQELGWHTGKRSGGKDRKFIQGKHFFRLGAQAHTSDVPQRICQDIANDIERLDQ